MDKDQVLMKLEDACSCISRSLQYIQDPGIQQWLLEAHNLIHEVREMVERKPT